MEALAAATKSGAFAAFEEKEKGTLEVGKLADLVAWRNDPLENAKVFTEREQAALVMKAGAVVKDIR
jgi:imidazolonepropionase-like amidohydrolase